MPEPAPEETPEEMPEEAPEEIPEDVPEEVPEEVPETAPEETPEEIPEEAPEEIPEEVPEEVPEETPEEIPETAPEETPEKVPEEIPEEVPEEALDDIPAEEPASLPFSVTEIDGILITLTAADESDFGSLPSVRTISDDALAACTENALGPKPGESRTVRVRHLLIKISGGTVSGQVKVRMEHAGLKKWKLEVGEEAESDALIVRLDNGKANRVKAAVLWDTDEISFEIFPETVLDYFLTAVSTDTESETETETVPESTAAAVSEEEIMEKIDDSHTEEPPETADEALPEDVSETEFPVAIKEPEEIIPESPPAAEPVAFNQSTVVNGVKISVTAAPGVFPAGAVLSVRRVTAAQQAQVNRAIDRVQDDQTRVARSYSFDIRILDENGNELQPAEGQTVNVSFSLAEVADANLQTTVYHMTEQENGDLNAEKLETQETGQTVIAQSDGFSVYTLTFYYDKCQYSLMPGGSIPVTDLVRMVGLTGTPSSVMLSSPLIQGSGVSLTGDMPDWTVTGETLPDFQPQTLTVTLQGISYEILLTVSDQEQKNDAVSYLDESGKKQAWTGGFMEVGNANLQSGGGFTGWWVVTGDITVDHRITAYGDVKLVLTDDHTLVVNGGIQVFPGNSLTIYGQEKGSGTLKAVSAEVNNETQTATGAGIGGAYVTEGTGDAGKITIHGGQISAVSNAPGCAGIGGGTNGTATVTITGGSVTGTGNGNGPGIGGNGKNTAVKITGGKATGIGGKQGGVDITGQKKEDSNPGEKTNKPGNTGKAISKISPDEDTSSGESKQYSEIDTDQDNDANESEEKSREIYDADAEEENDPSLTDASEPKKYAPRGSVYHRQESDEEDPLWQMEGKNVILISVSGSCEGSRMLPVLEQDGILYSNYLAAQMSERTPEEVLRKGMDEIAASSAEELIASFGFQLAPEKAPAMAADLSAAEAGEYVNERIKWILSVGYSLNTEGFPFYIGIQLRSTYSGILSPAMDPTEASDSLTVFDNCLESLVDALCEYNLLDHTVIILLTDQDGRAVIVHPGREYGVTVSEETGDEDVLKTILILGLTENGSEESLPEGLKGQDLLSLPESAEAQ